MDFLPNRPLEFSFSIFKDIAGRVTFYRFNVPLHQRPACNLNVYKGDTYQPIPGDTPLLSLIINELMESSCAVAGIGSSQPSELIVSHYSSWWRLHRTMLRILRRHNIPHIVLVNERSPLLLRYLARLQS